MVLYNPTAISSITWPEPIETLWQNWEGGGVTDPRWKRPDLGLAERLLISGVMNMSERPRGLVTWLAEWYKTSRPTLYAIGKWGRSPMQPLVANCARAGCPVATETRRVGLERLALKLAFPGKVALRPMQECLAEVFGRRPGLGTLSTLLLTAGRRAGDVLHGIDTSPLGPVIVIRDETFFHGWPLLLVIEPVSSVILMGLVSEDRQAETWGLALLEAQAGGAQIVGIIEDMARPYNLSRDLIDLDISVLKDPWHVARNARQVGAKLARSARQAAQKVAKLEKKLLKEWDESLFTECYIPAVAEVERLQAQHDEFAFWVDCLADALEMVDLRSGEIRERDINSWLLNETISALAAIPDKRVQELVRTLRRHHQRDHLLTFLNWLHDLLAPWLSRLADEFDDPADYQFFIRSVARAWRLRQAVIAGHRSWRSDAQQAQELVDLLRQEYPDLAQAVDALFQSFDAAGHTSSLIECVNSLLQAFLVNRKSFQSPETAQAYLNLFILWHNMRVYEARCKRGGQSPYQRAGIDPGSDDWLALLGYPASQPA